MEKENKELKETIKKLQEQIDLLKTINRLSRDAEQLMNMAGYPRMLMPQPVIYHPQYIAVPQYIPYMPIRTFSHRDFYQIPYQYA